MRKTLTFASLILLSLAATACADTPTSAPASAPAPNELLVGQWTGSWASSNADMGGSLKCAVTALPGKDGYHAVFDAVFARILTHHQAVTLKVSDKGEKNAKWAFGGKENLGLLNGGVYTYDGWTDGEDFVCTYDSTFDKGTFKMKRAK